jgi:hypothetical protein
MNELAVRQAIKARLIAANLPGISAGNIILQNDWEAFTGEPGRFPCICLQDLGGQITSPSPDRAKVGQVIGVALVTQDTEADQAASPFAALAQALMNFKYNPGNPASTLQIGRSVDVQSSGGFKQKTLTFEVAEFLAATNV